MTEIYRLYERKFKYLVSTKIFTIIILKYNKKEHKTKRKRRQERENKKPIMT